MPGSLSYESISKEYEFPDFKTSLEIKCDENLFIDMGNPNQESNEIDVKQLESLTEEVDMLKCKIMYKDLQE